jgi:peroxiredoxin
MNFKHLLLSILALFVFFFATAQEHKQKTNQYLSAHTPQTWKLNPGDIAPIFTFKDSKGKKVSFKDFRGKYVFIEIWSTTCGSCIRQFPYLKQLEEDMKGKNISFVSISIEQNWDIWQNMLKKHNLKGHQWNIGDAKNFMVDYEVWGLPAFIVLDKEGKILYIRRRLHPSNPNTIKVLNALEGI